MKMRPSRILVTVLLFQLAALAVAQAEENLSELTFLFMIPAFVTMRFSFL
jgi:hypothetical protein